MEAIQAANRAGQPGNFNLPQIQPAGGPAPLPASLQALTGTAGGELALAMGPEALHQLLMAFKNAAPADDEVCMKYTL